MRPSRPSSPASSSRLANMSLRLAHEHDHELVARDESFDAAVLAARDIFAGLNEDELERRDFDDEELSARELLLDMLAPLTKRTLERRARGCLQLGGTTRYQCNSCLEDFDTFKGCSDHSKECPRAGLPSTGRTMKQGRARKH